MWVGLSDEFDPAGFVFIEEQDLKHTLLQRMIRMTRKTMAVTTRIRTATKTTT